MIRRSHRAHRASPIDIGAWIAALLALAPLAALAYAMELTGFGAA